MLLSVLAPVLSMSGQCFCLCIDHASVSVAPVLSMSGQCFCLCIDHVSVSTGPSSVNEWTVFLFVYSRPVYFYTFGIKFMLWRPSLRFYAWAARCYTFGGRVSDFGLTTIDLCDKSYQLSAKPVTQWRIWKTRFGWLPLMQGPINVKLTRTFARMWIFSLATAFSECTRSMVRIFNDVQQAESRNGAFAATKQEFERRKDATKFSSRSILRPYHTSDLRHKGQSTLTVPRVMQIFQTWWQARDCDCVG